MSNRITVEPDVCNGKPVIRRTRSTARTVLEFLGAGNSVDDVQAEDLTLTLTREDVQACLDYAVVSR